jgi:hypothetical protein
LENPDTCPLPLEWPLSLRYTRFRYRSYHPP